MSHEHLTDYDTLAIDPQRHALSASAPRSVLRTALARLAGEQAPALDGMQTAMSREGQVRSAMSALRA